ncbi:hypothetical protein CHUAL_002648 [Chamberlinius hualienensis]
MTTKIVKSNNTRLLQRYTLFVIVSWLFTLGRVRALEVPKANCRSDITDVSSKAFLAPIVFEATVKGVFTHPNSTSQSARSIGSDQSPSSFHQVNLQVDKIYKVLLMIMLLTVILSPTGSAYSTVIKICYQKACVVFNLRQNQKQHRWLTRQFYQKICSYLEIIITSAFLQQLLPKFL